MGLFLPLLHRTSWTLRSTLNMRIIAAYLLAVLGGNSSPSGSDIKKILESVGVEAEDEKIELLVGELSGKDVFQVIEEGKKKLGAVPVGALPPLPPPRLRRRRRRRKRTM